MGNTHQPREMADATREEFEVRQIEKNDREEICRMLRQGRMEKFPAFYKEKLLYNYKVQMPLFLLSLGANHYLQINSMWVILQMSILNCLLYYISYKAFDYFFSNLF